MAFSELQDLWQDFGSKLSRQPSQFRLPCPLRSAPTQRKPAKLLRSNQRKLPKLKRSLSPIRAKEVALRLLWHPLRLALAWPFLQKPWNATVKLFPSTWRMSGSSERRRFLQTLSKWCRNSKGLCKLSTRKTLWCLWSASSATCAASTWCGWTIAFHLLHISRSTREQSRSWSFTTSQSPLAWSNMPCMLEFCRPSWMLRLSRHLVAGKDCRRKSLSWPGSRQLLLPQLWCVRAPQSRKACCKNGCGIVWAQSASSRWWRTRQTWNGSALNSVKTWFRWLCSKERPRNAFSTWCPRETAWEPVSLRKLWWPCMTRSWSGVQRQRSWLLATWQDSFFSFLKKHVSRLSI